MIKKTVLLLALFIAFAAVIAQGKEEWNTSKSTHFIVYFKNAPESFIEQLISESEGYYDKIADNLGFTRFNFWLWDDRAKIYIYDSAEDYHKSTGQPAWSAGAARPQEKIIYTYPYARGFFETVLPHEMGHIIFREFVGFDNPAVPLWLDEGVASYQQGLERLAFMPAVKRAALEGTLIPLEKLSDIKSHSIAGDDSVQLYYAEAASIIDYLIKEHGKNNFVLFCQDLRDKRNLERAICSVYPVMDMEDFGRKWEKYIKK